MDQIVRIVAVANGWTTVYGILGVAGYARDRKWTPAETQKTHANNVKVEKEIHPEAVRSGFRPLGGQHGGFAALGLDVR